MTIQEFDEKHKEEKKKKPSSSKKEGGSTSKANKSQEAAPEEDEDTRLRGFDRGLQVLLKSCSKYFCNNDFAVNCHIFKCALITDHFLG